jgi:hypothetical protein
MFGCVIPNLEARVVSSYIWFCEIFVFLELSFLLNTFGPE